MILYAWSPSARFMASVSARSPSGVEVPCALRYSTWSTFTPASFSADSMQRDGPSPFSLGAVMWKASCEAPKPASSQ